MARRTKEPEQVIAWEPHPGPQTEFVNAKEFEVLYGGAKAGGKSEGLIICPLSAGEPNFYINIAGYKALLIRRTYKRLLELKDRCDRLYLGGIDRGGCRYSKDEHRYYFSTGAIIQLGHCEHEEDKWNYWGHEYQCLAIDQLEEFTESQYSILRMCARSSIEGVSPIIRATANPGVRWVKEYFVDVAPPNTVFNYTVETPRGDSITLTRRFIPATIYDNLTLVKQNPQYVALLASEPNERLRRMNLAGDWDVPENAAFDEFDKKRHVKKLHELFPGSGMPPQGWTVYGTMDWGFAKPFAVYWHVITPYDKKITFKEYYGIKWDDVTKKFKTNVGIKLIGKEVAKRIVEKSQGLNVEFIIADRAIWGDQGNEAGSVGTEIEEVLAAAGIPMIRSKKGRGSRLARKMQTHSHLANAPDGQPWWIIADCCQHLIRTLGQLPIDENQEDSVDTDAEDHAWDSVSYGFLQFPLDTDSYQSQTKHNPNVEPFRGGNQNHQPFGSLADTYQHNN